MQNSKPPFPHKWAKAGFDQRWINPTLLASNQWLQSKMTSVSPLPILVVDSQSLTQIRISKQKQPWIKLLWCFLTRNEYECGKGKNFRENSESLETGMRIPQNTSLCKQFQPTPTSQYKTNKTSYCQNLLFLFYSQEQMLWIRS